MKVTNKHGLPLPIVRAVENDPYHLEDRGWISVTELIDSPRIRLLKKQHWDEIEEDAADRFWALFGQGVHAVLERASDPDLCVAERRFRAEVDGLEVTGKADLVMARDGESVLTDYKTTSAWSFLYGPVKPEWERQLNCLCWLASKNGQHVDRLTVTVIYRDWTEWQAAKSAKYPPCVVMEHEVCMWTTEEQWQYIKDRVSLHRFSEDLLAETQIAPPICTPEERWQRNGGESTRCKAWCPVRAFCDYGIEIAERAK